MSGRVWAQRSVMSGVPCFYGTRIPVAVVRQMVDFETVRVEDVGDYYPSLAGRDLSHAVKPHG